MKILIVDDHPLVREAIRAVLGRLYGEVAVTATGPNEAKEAFLAHAPDLVVLDYDLGEGPTGADLAVWMRQRSPSVRIGLISGSDDIVRHLEEAGADFYLSKPFGPDDLVRLVFPSLTGTSDAFILEDGVWERET